MIYAKARDVLEGVQVSRLMSGPVHIRVVRPSDLSISETDSWEHIQEEAPDLANPFLAPGFARAVGLVRDTARVAVLSGDDGPVGFFAYEQGRFGVGRPMGGDLSDHQAVVALPDVAWHAPALLAACGLQALSLVNYPRALLPAAVTQVRAYPSPVIDLRHGYDNYLSERRSASRSFVQSVWRKRRKLEREVGEVRFVFEERSPEALATVMRWKSAQYAELSEWDRFADPRNVALLQHLADTGETGCAGILSVLYAGDRIAAAHFGLRSRTVLCSWFPTYNVELAAYSPGILLHFLMTEAAAAVGIDAFDLGRGEHGYKDRIKNRDLELTRGWLFRSSPGGLAWRAITAPQQRYSALESPLLRAHRAAQACRRGDAKTRGIVLIA
jgi:CelD/BcsL family acetyltransferase involved in cellulose biosynthesis